jgi:hypothetical protein
MILTVVAADKKAFTTVERAIKLGDLKGVSTDRLPGLIDAASRIIEAFCSRIFYRERVSSFGCDLRMISMTRFPVVEIHGVSINGDPIDSTVWGRDSSNFVSLPALQSSNWYPYPDQADGGGYYPLVRDRIEYAIDYDGGYLMPGSEQGIEGDPTEPADLELACIEIVRTLALAGAADPRVTAVRLGDFSTTYGGKAVAMADHVKAILQPYRLLVL